MDKVIAALTIGAIGGAVWLSFVAPALAGLSSALSIR